MKLHDQFGLTGWGLIIVGSLITLIISGVLFLVINASREHALGNSPPGVEILVRPTNEWTGLFRFRDVDAGVTCYSAREGLSCVRAP